MSDIKKGARKSKNDRDMDGYTAGKQQIKPELVTAVLIAVLYALFLVEAGLEGGVVALVLSAFLFVAFAVFAYFVGSGKLKGRQQFRSLIYAFLGLSALSMVWELLRFFNVIDMAGAGTFWAAAVGVVNAAFSVVIIAVILYVEKDRLEKLYIAVGDKKVIALGAAGFVLSLLLAVGAAYFVFGGNAISQDKFLQILASVLVLGVLGGIIEELWFRGLLLSRITPLLGESQGNIYQAAVFGVFETLMFYTITSEAVYLPVIFIIGAFTGYYWGRATLKAKSLVAPMFLHAGLYVLILLPLLAGQPS